MKFRLQFRYPSLVQKFSHQTGVIMIGSCFAEEIGLLLQRAKLEVLVNPHGILYDPLSMAVSLRACLANEPVKEEDLFWGNDAWNSLSHHGRFSHPDKAACLAAMNTAIQEAHLGLKKAGWLVLTFGSAYVHRHLPSGKLAGNCHKLPQAEFEKKLAAGEHLLEEYSRLVERLVQFNPGLNLLLTVSPVRYVRDGIVENNLSKAVLLQLAHSLAGRFGPVHYFPAYEYVIDDLRDYRFFKEDLVHPNELALKYVWERFSEYAFDERTRLLNERVAEIQAAIAHRPLHPGTKAHRDFLERGLEKCRQLAAEEPALDLSVETAFFRGALRKV